MMTSTMTSFPTFILTFTILIRILVGFSHHSGESNYHGSKTAYGGDYEAQRHWMELTLHLPLSKWYTYDPQYWGLDYPPLMAYGSLLFGFMSHVLVGEESVALDKSRGYEDEVHKSFMRFTVLALDLVFFIPIVWFLSHALSKYSSLSSSSFYLLSNSNSNNNIQFYIILTVTLLQPAILLIDHGHFQYNSFCLGLSLLSFYLVTTVTIVTTTITSSSSTTKTNTTISTINVIHTRTLLGCICFCLALNWKQMTLYYSPAIFAYLLGKCFGDTLNYNRNWGNKITTNTTRSSSSSKTKSTRTTLTQLFISLKRILILGITVISTFFILWAPFIIYDTSTYTLENPSSSSSLLSRHIVIILQILHRIFPFQRGLFEGKVSNIWCVLSLKPLSIRNRIPIHLQSTLALILTMVLMMPFCIILFQAGKKSSSLDISSSSLNIKLDEDKDSSRNRKIVITGRHLQHQQMRDFKILLWGATGVSLSFFLASFQVHEKSILLPLAPLSLLVLESRTFVLWFSLVSSWTMWHLLCIDRLQVTYVCCMVLFLVLIWLLSELVHHEEEEDDDQNLNVKGTRTILDKFVKLISSKIMTWSSAVMVMLHVLESVCIPPSNLPDIFPVLWTIGGCGMLCFSWLYVLRSLSKEVTKTIKVS